MSVFQVVVLLVVAIWLLKAIMENLRPGPPIE